MIEAEPVWRCGAVARARTVAPGLRLVDVAVAGVLAPFRPGDRAAVALATGAAGLVWFPCLPGPPGHVRIAVERAAGGAAGFLWRLVEGAPVRLALARRPAGPCQELAVEGGGAANDNVAPGRATPPRPVPGTGRRSRAGAPPRR